MNEKEILRKIKSTLDQAPIDLLEKIKDQPIRKMKSHDSITRQTIRRSPLKRFLPYASLAAVFIVVLLGWQFQVRSVDSQIYFDLNPSVRIETNKYDQVIDIYGENPDGQRIAQQLAFKGKSFEVVTNDLLEIFVQEKYLDLNHEYLLLSVYNKDQKKADSLRSKIDGRIHEYLVKYELQPIVLSQRLDDSSTIEKYAREYGLSVSKMTFIRNLLILNPEWKVEELVDLSLEQLVYLGRGIGLDLDKIIDSKDLDRLKDPVLDPPYSDYDDDDYDDDDSIHNGSNATIISEQQARNIALSRFGGRIIGVDFDDDDMEYEIELEVGDTDYELLIDARTGEILEIEKDD